MTKSRRENQKAPTTTTGSTKRKKRPNLLIEPPLLTPVTPAGAQDDEEVSSSRHDHYNCHQNRLVCAGKGDRRGWRETKEQQGLVFENTGPHFINERIANKWREFNEERKTCHESFSETKSTTTTTSVIQQQPSRSGQPLAAFKMTCPNDEDDHQQWKHKQQASRQRQRRRNDLGSYLMILFGSISVLLLAGCPSMDTTNVTSAATGRPSPLNASFAATTTRVPTTTTTTTTTRAATVVLSANQTPATINGNTSAVTAAVAAAVVAPAESSATSEESDITRMVNGETTVSANEEDQPAAGSEGDDEADRSPSLVASSPAPTTTTSSSGEEDNASEEDQDDQLGAGKNKLADLIVDTADGGVDLMLSHLRPTESDIEETTNSTSPELETENNKHTASALKSSPMSEELRLAMETYGKWRAAGDDIIELFSRKLLPVIVEHGYDVDTSTVSGLLQVFNGIRALKPWALKLLDASAKITPGLLVGTQSDFGDFDECLSVRVDDPSGLVADNGFPAEYDPLTGLKTSTLVGRYCLADVEFPKPPRQRLASAANQTDPPKREEGDFRPQTEFAPIELRRPLLNFSETAAFKDTIFVETANFFHMLYVDPIRVGVCLTNKIDPDSLAQVLNKLLEEFRVTINFKGRCVTKYDRPTWTSYQLASAYILLVVCGLVVLCTLLDLAHSKLNKLPCPSSLRPARMRLHQAAFRYRPLFTSFSMIRNTKRLFRTSSTPAECRHQFQLNLSQAAAAATDVGRGSISMATTTSSIPDSSVESSPSIERRSCSLDANSATDLIISRKMQLAPQQAKATGNRLLLASHNSSASAAAELLALQAAMRANYLRSGSVSGSSAASSPLDEQHGKPASINLLNLHGIRVITMTWMIVNHTYLFGGFFVLWAHRRLIDIAEWPKSLSFQLVLNGWLTVETYFFLSALIIVLCVLPMMKVHKFNYITYVIHRLLRLLPAYVGLVCLNFLWPLISSGPVWLVKGKSFIQTPCENYLWTNFLFINNWIWPEKQCMVHTWFLSADFQLYVLAPIIVYLLYRRPTLGHSVNLIVAILASILSGFVIYANKLLPTTLINKLEFDSIKQQLSYSYFATYQHMGPYCLGILTGYVLHTRPTIRLPKHLTWMLWLLLPPLSFTTLLLTYLWNGAYDDPDLINPSPLVSALYVAIHRIIWTSLVAWIVFAAATGRAKLLSNFLSHSIFIPLSRLSYSIYLVHLPVIMFRALNLRHTLEWTDSNILWEACGNFVMSLIMGFFLNIAFESPMVNLENFIFRRRSDTRAEHAACIERTEASGHNSAPLKIGEQKFNSPQNGASSNGGRQSPLDANSYLQRKDSGDHNDLFQTKGSLSSSLSTNDTKDGNSLESTGQELANSSLDQQQDTTRNTSLADTSSQLTGGSQMSSKLPANGRMGSNRRQSLRASDLSKRTNSSYEDHDDNHSQLQSSGNHPSIDLMTEMRQHQQRQVSPYDTRYQQGYVNKDGDTYNIRAEYQHYAPGAYQQWRLSNLTSRPSQYATLARNHRLGQDMYQNYFDGPPRPFVSSSPTQRHRRESSLLGETINRATKPPTHLGESHMAPLVSPGYDTNISHGSNRPRVRQHLSRGQGRYYTLTGTGSRDWRLRYDHEEANEGSLVQNWHAQQPPLDSANQPNSSKWLPPGTMIPRVDSSTLRRQSRRGEPAETSIVEEPAGEESSAL